MPDSSNSQDLSADIPVSPIALDYLATSSSASAPPTRFDHGNYDGDILVAGPDNSDESKQPPQVQPAAPVKPPRKSGESRQRLRLDKVRRPVSGPSNSRSTHLSCEGCRLRKLKCSRHRHCTACRTRNEPCIWRAGRPSAEVTSLDVHHGLSTAHREADRLGRLVRFLTTRYIQREAIIAQAEGRRPRPPPSLFELVESEKAVSVSARGTALEEAEALLSLATPTDGFAGADIRYGLDDMLLDRESSPGQGPTPPLSANHAQDWSRAPLAPVFDVSGRSVNVSHARGEGLPVLRVAIPTLRPPGLPSARSLMQETLHVPSPLSYPPLVPTSSISPPPPLPVPPPHFASGILPLLNPAERQSSPVPHANVFPADSSADASNDRAEIRSVIVTPTFFYPILPPPLMSQDAAALLADARTRALETRNDAAILERRKTEHERRWAEAVSRLAQDGKEQEEQIAETMEPECDKPDAGSDSTDKLSAVAASTSASNKLPVAFPGPSGEDADSTLVPTRSPSALDATKDGLGKDLVASAIDRQHQALQIAPPARPNQRPILSLDAAGAFSALGNYSLLRTPSALSSSTPSTRLGSHSLLFGGGGSGHRITLSPLRSAVQQYSAIEEGLRPIDSLLLGVVPPAAEEKEGDFDQQDDSRIDERFEPRAERLTSFDDTVMVWDRFEPRAEGGRRPGFLAIEGKDEWDKQTERDAALDTDGQSSLGDRSRRGATADGDDEEHGSGASGGNSTD